MQTALCIPKSDGLAAALNVWGLVLAVRAANRHGKLYPAAMLFAAAWSAKITTIFGLAAVCVWLVATARQRLAWRLGAQTVCGYLLVACLTIFASHGRVVEIFRACASGGTHWSYIAEGPLWLIAWTIYSDASLAFLSLISLYVIAVSVAVVGLLPPLRERVLCSDPVCHHRYFWFARDRQQSLAGP